MTDPIELCLAGILSPHVALSRAILNGVDPNDIIDRLADRSGEPAAELRMLLQRADDLRTLRATAIAGAIDHTLQGRQALEMLKTGFDRAVSVSPEASVAAYSLADPATLAAATIELVAWMTDRSLLQPSYRALDLGCGIGRIAAAIAAMVQTVIGIDISPAMIAEAQRRYAPSTRLRFEVTDGLRLPGDADSLDLIIAVDSFPYLVQAGVAESHVADSARLLRAGGVLTIFNLSYYGLDHDHAAAQAWCNRFGYQLIDDGITPFRLWDAAVFLMRKLTD